MPVPRRESLGVPQQREIVDGDDHGATRADGPAHRGAMDEIRLARGSRDPDGVPGEVADDGRGAPRPTEAQRPHLQAGPVLEGREEPPDDSGSPRIGLRERRHVEPDDHRAPP